VRTYRGSGLRVLPVVEEILGNRALYAHLDHPDMVKSPLVYVAGALRGARKPINSDSYTWMLANMGQTPFRPPSVAGWDWGTAWLTSGTIRARLDASNMMIGWDDDAVLHVPDHAGRADLGAQEQVELALRALGSPWSSDATRSVLTNLAHGYFDDVRSDDEEGRRNRAAMLQRTLRNLLLSGPDAHLH
jgi:hypothetical protein